MRRRFLGNSLWFLAAVAGAGCQSAAPSSPNSFTKVYENVIGPTCTNDYCHYAGIGLRLGALDMSSKVVAYWSLADVPCQAPACSSQGTRVIPGDPDGSILYLKVSQSTPKCGAQMPASIASAMAPAPKAEFSGTKLGDDQLKLIYNWILEGAQND